jgi:hypothetical protein
MADQDIPDLGSDIRLEIEQEREDINKNYLQQLSSFLVEDFPMLALPQSRKPETLKRLVASYAFSLFHVEAKRYISDDDSELAHWLAKLAQRVVEDVEGMIDALESGSLIGKLSYHATKLQMREAMSEALRKNANVYLADPHYALTRLPKQAKKLPITTKRRIASTKSKRIQAKTQARPKEKRVRLSSTITSPTAARKLERFLVAKAMGVPEFAEKAQTTDRTIRSFRKTGKVRRSIFENIANAMGITKDELLH